MIYSLSKSIIKKERAQNLGFQDKREVTHFKNLQK